MTYSKGTFDFINALKILPPAIHEKFIIIFGGKVKESELRDYLLEFIKNYKKYEVIYNDKFISFEDLCSYISISDYIVIPYKRIDQSSGILGYAALYNVPVIGPSAGLLGEIITKNKLGITIQKVSSEELAKILKKLTKADKITHIVNSEKYISQNSIEKFTNEIFF